MYFDDSTAEYFQLCKLRACVQIMYLMAMEQFMYHTKTTGNYAYYAIAAIHGVHIEYNKQMPSGEQG